MDIFFYSDYEDIKKRFSEQLKEKMKKRKISQRKLASKVGVTKSSISLYVNGDRLPKDENVFLSICNEVGISIEDLLKDDFKQKLEKASKQQQDNINEEKIRIYNKILEMQGDLLYTTLSEECAELIQACTKIQRKKYYGKGFEIDNLLEEINDVELNIKLIKKQLTREPSLNLTEEEINKKLKEWDEIKTKKLKKIF